MVVDKPAGMTSHDVIDELRRRFRTRRIGHAGTLDPGATGVLVVGIGKATRLLDLSQAHPKAYRVTARFGVTTTTQDAAGEVIAERSAADLTAAAVRDALPRYTGQIEQVPPMVSAVKVGGERLYKKAMRGEEVERAARRVTIHELSLESFAPGDRAEGTLFVRCSSGTYVRTLVHDLGGALGHGAHVTLLRRVEAGGFAEAQAVPLDAITPADVRPLAAGLPFLPAIELDVEEAARVATGGRIARRRRGPGSSGYVALLADGELVAVYRREGEELVAHRVIPR